MGFLIKMWHLITSIAVILPKVWPLLKVLSSKLLDYYAKKRVEEKKLEDIKEAAKEAEETGNTGSLEAHFGTGESVVAAEKINNGGLSDVALAGSSDTFTEEKKKNSEVVSSSTTGGEKSSDLLASAGRIAAAGIGIYLVSQLLKKKEAKAASMGFSSTTSGIILDGSGTIKNYSVYRGGFRVGSRLLP